MKKILKKIGKLLLISLDALFALFDNISNIGIKVFGALVMIWIVIPTKYMNSTEDVISSNEGFSWIQILLIGMFGVSYVFEWIKQYDRYDNKYSL